MDNADKQNNLIVASFNVKRDIPIEPGQRWKVRKHAVADSIIKSKADVVGVQELTTYMRNDLKLLLSNYGCPFQFVGVGRARLGHGEQTAILFKKSKFKVQKSNTIWISNRPHIPGSRANIASLPRTITICEAFYKPWNTSIRILNTHLDNVWSSARMLGARNIISQIRQANTQRKMPTVVTGDMNATPDDPVIRVLSGMGAATNNKSPAALTNALKNCSSKTYHGLSKSGQEKRTLDYIFITDDLKTLECGVDQEKYFEIYPSDHFLVWAKLCKSMCF